MRVLHLLNSWPFHHSVLYKCHVKRTKEKKQNEITQSAKRVQITHTTIVGYYACTYVVESACQSVHSFQGHNTSGQPDSQTLIFTQSDTV